MCKRPAARRKDSSSATAMNDRKWRSISNSGHFLPEEQPGEVVRHIRALHARLAG